MSAVVFYESSSELATLGNTFSVSGTATDPTTVSLAVTDPTGTTTTYTYAGATITKTATGVYTKDIACSTAGTWTAVWTGTGTASDVATSTWEVWETALGHLYATVDALKSRLGITDTADDVELHGACYAASRWVEQFCQRLFYRSATGTARTFVAQDWWTVKFPEFSDVVSVSALATDDAGDGTFETTWSASDYQLLPNNPSAAPETRPYTSVRAVAGRTFPLPWGMAAREDRVQITGVYGWPAVPVAVKQAALIVASETFKLKDSFAGQGGFNEYGPVPLRRNPQAIDFLRPYRRHTVLVG
jgi:hypothetical protein